MYTSHGHPIPGTPVNELPALSILDCGGIATCEVCIEQSWRAQKAYSERQHLMFHKLNPQKPSRYLTKDDISLRFGRVESSKENEGLHDLVTKQFKQFAELLNLSLPNRSSTEICFIHLEDAFLWAHRCIDQENYHGDI